MALALRYIGPTKTSILTAVEPMTAIFFGVLVFDEVLSIRQIFGVAVILLSVILVVTGKNPKQAEQKSVAE